MALFQINDKKVKRVKPTEFKLEKDIQKLVEENIEVFFNCRFLASEHSTGSIHSGRIDTLAFSEENNPVIIEYKKVASSELVNQSLYYLHWITDHKGDFQIAVHEQLGKSVEVDWSDIRVICIAPEFKKYDIHAVQMMGASIELWQYKLYENGVLRIDEIFGNGESSSRTSVSNGKNLIMVAAGHKAAETRRTAVYDISDHQNKINGTLAQYLEELREYIATIDSSIEEQPRKNYIAYKTTQNFVCIEVQKKRLLLFLKLDAKDYPSLSNVRDVSNIGHFGTGDFEFSLNNQEALEVSKQLILESYQSIGG
ncbi:MAG: putative transport protein [Saprospiraceae bacterium]|jgi:predicted transport protein